MPSHRSLRNTFLGLVAGLFSALVGLLLAYIGGVVIIGIKTRELYVTLVTAGSFLPLMLIFVLLIPTFLISLLVGVTIAAVDRFAIPIGLVVGVALSEIVLSWILPMILVPQGHDFTSIVSNYLLSGLYGLILGGVAAIFYRWLNAET